MKHRNARRLDRLGLSLIRVIIASYFLAVSVHLIEGAHPSALFSHMDDAAAANILGSFVLFIGAYLLMCGLAVRLVSIYLALLVLGSSVMQNFVLGAALLPDPFWRDLVLVAALILNYGALTTRDLETSAFVRRAYRVRRAMPAGAPDSPITPRRISTGFAQCADRAPRPGARQGADPVYPAPVLPQARDESEIVNIFA